jgi:hypothetical protein
MPRLIIAVAIGMTLVLTVGLSDAGAHKRKLARQTTVNFEDLPGSTGDRISGQVSLGQKPEEPPPDGGEPLARAAGLAASCLKGQRVEIRHRAFAAAINRSAEKSQQEGAELVATAVTDASGAWQTTAYEASAANQLLFDAFFVEVVKKRLPPKNARHKHVCLGAFANKTVFSY